MKLKLNTGFTLLEILIALFIGLTLVGILVQNYLSAKRIYKVQNEIAHFSEDIRFASSFLQQSIMQAGFVGCRRISELDFFEAPDVIHGYDSRGTDVIVITKAKSESTTLTKNANAGDTSISVKKNLTTKSNQLLLISDCNNAELFTAGDTLKHSYQINNTTVRQFERITFFISEVSYPTAENKHTYSLYFLVNHGEKQELIPEISNMQIDYGVDTLGENKITEHLKAVEITNRNLWDKVLSVAITLTPQDRLPGLKPWKIYIKLRERG